ncbi:Conjugal transfer protein TraG [Aquisphaera giovannonii]|uniref:Conjugal transfer protein TraG n=1 Tax=Aquisphaera giovannonii TaxID=406548 RepID=A0A5B9W8A1_9BACT|nr:type IV secretory system conjugative DNA transfer family protein [Aquisphaera giovannonii]QEH36597.1 Conjugal transfer protein TraG [Aquisphaera giovannonii]
MRLIRLILIASVLLAAYCIALLVYLFPWFWGVIGLGAGYSVVKKGHALHAHGTARWATWRDLPRNSGLLIGRMASRSSLWLGIVALVHRGIRSSVACDVFLSALRRDRKELVRVPAIHAAIFAPTGAGKGVSCVIPHLLTNRDSCVVLDPKGENALKTANVRRRMGHKVVLLDPFKVVTETPDQFNALDFIHADSETALDDCDALADSLVIRNPNEHEPHWSEKASQRIGSLAACIVSYQPGGCLRDVAEVSSDPQKAAGAIQYMTKSAAWDGILAQLGHELGQPLEKELSGILSTVSRHLKFLNTPLVAANTKTSSFDPAELVNGKMTIYLILPTQYLRSHAGLLRMWISSMLRAVVRCGTQEDRLVHFLIDEAASLGHMEALDDALDKLRGYGVRLQLYYQSVGQLKVCWPDGRDQTLLSNTTQIFFCVNDKDTAEYVSARLGEKTILVDSGGSSGGVSHQIGDRTYSENWNTGWQQVARKLLKPEEVLQLGERTAITFHPGCPPICTTLVRYFEEPTLGRRPKRFWPLVRTWLDAVLLLAAAAFVAFILTQIAREASPPGGAVQPSGSANTFTSDFWMGR